MIDDKTYSDLMEDGALHLYDRPAKNSLEQSENGLQSTEAHYIDREML